MVTWRVWLSTAKAIYLNLTLDGQLWVESCGSDVVWWQTGSQWDSWHRLTLSPVRLVASWLWLRDEVGPCRGFAYRGLSVPPATSDTLVDVAL